MQDPKYPEAHPWTLKKLEFLKRYLPAFVKATQKAISRHYVDGFAGPGYNRQEDGTLVEGSPLLALQHQFTSFFFVEKDNRSYTQLERNLRERNPSLSNIHLYRGDFNLFVDDILQQIHPRAPTLFFLDSNSNGLQSRKSPGGKRQISLSSSVAAELTVSRKITHKLWTNSSGTPRGGTCGKSRGSPGLRPLPRLTVTG